MFCDVKKFINRISCSIKENDMVFKEKIKAELKAYVRFLGEMGDVPVKGIVHHCGISRASVYCCLKSANQAQKKSKKHGRPRLIDARQERKIQRTIARLREQEGNFSKCGPNLDTQFCVEVFVEFYVYTPTEHTPPFSVL